ncbi:dynein light chain Tctex-type 5-B-like isoform X2 [Ptychodera flava]|uniref:dynein light chain Tctex-type 5-B-like isoform X2 n=1 Tax=Ptychodera flava TaxID=63121 RepID=UPI003969D6CD
MRFTQGSQGAGQSREQERDTGKMSMRKKSSVVPPKIGDRRSNHLAPTNVVRQSANSRISSVSTVSFMDEPHEPMRGPPVRLEPTFQLKPNKKFPVVQVKNILKDVLESYLSEEKYEPELCRQMTKTISEVVKARVKDLQVKRYKVIVLIHIGQLKDQGMRMGSRCLWDPENDTFSSYEYKNNSLFAIGSVYGVYYE